MVEQLKTMSEISMLTLLLRASATVKNRNGDPSLHGYVETEEMRSQMLHDVSDTSKDANFALLDCLSDILVQNTQVLATSYDDAYNFAVVMPSSDPELPVDDSHVDKELDDSHGDMEIPPLASVASAPTLLSLDAAVIPNPNDRSEDSSQLDGALGNIREITDGKSLWSASKEDPLDDDVLE
jgi:hypothetical protein